MSAEPERVVHHSFYRALLGLMRHKVEVAAGWIRIVEVDCRRADVLVDGLYAYDALDRPGCPEKVPEHAF